MANTQVVIRKEKLPVRCEMCHQADLFDPETGRCQRCAGIDPETVDLGPRTLSEKERAAYFRRLNEGIEYERRRQGVQDSFSFFEVPTTVFLKIALVLLGMLLILFPMWWAHQPRIPRRPPNRAGHL